MPRSELTSVHGVPETVLTDGLLDSLPDNEAHAPWECECSAVIWLGRGGPAARQALPPGIAAANHAIAVVGGLIRYTSTPVGPYDEVLGAVGFRHRFGLRGHVAFMAVDSAASLVGGRTNWAMPKTLATFYGEPAAGETMTATSADAARTWSVSATPQPFGPTVPARTAAAVVQQFAGGRLESAVLKTSFAARLSLVEVSVDGTGDLPLWLRPGRHLGLTLPRMTFTLGATTPV